VLAHLTATTHMFWHNYATISRPIIVMLLKHTNPQTVILWEQNWIKSRSCEIFTNLSSSKSTIIDNRKRHLTRIKQNTLF